MGIENRIDDIVQRTCYKLEGSPFTRVIPDADTMLMNRRNFIKLASNAALLASVAPARVLHGTPGEFQGNNPYLCISSKHLQWLGVTEMAQLAAEIGFTGIDLAVRKGSHVLPENVQRDLPIAVAKIREVGLEVPMITTAITRADDPAARDILETAGKLGIGIYRPGWYRYENGDSVSVAISNARRQLSELQVINEANNIASSYQNHAGRYVGSSGWDLRDLVQDLNPRWTGVQFDIRHAVVEGPESWPMVLEILAPWINSIDIKDYNWDVNEGIDPLSVPLGQGLVPLDDFLQLLDDLDIRADFSVHCEYPLGGAEHGDSSLSIPRDDFIKRVESDLEILKASFQN